MKKTVMFRFRQNRSVGVAISVGVAMLTREFLDLSPASDLMLLCALSLAFAFRLDLRALMFILVPFPKGLWIIDTFGLTVTALQLITPLCLVVGLVAVFRAPRGRLQVRKLLILAILIPAVGILFALNVIFVSQNPETMPGAWNSILNNGVSLGAAAFLFLRVTKKELHEIAKAALSSVGVFLAIWSAIAFESGGAKTSSFGIDGRRFAFPMENSNWMGAYVLGLAIIHVLSRTPGQVAARKDVALLTLVGGAVALSGSRGVTLALILVCVALFSAWNRFDFARGIFIIFGFGTGVVASSFLLRSHNPVARSSVLLEESADEPRTQLLLDTLEVAMRHLSDPLLFLFGVGYRNYLSTYQVGQSSHNAFFSLWFEMGAIVVLVLALLALYTVRTLYRSVKPRERTTLLLCVAAFVTVLTFSARWDAPIWLLLVGISAGLAWSSDKPSVADRRGSAQEKPSG